MRGVLKGAMPYRLYSLSNLGSMLRAHQLSVPLRAGVRHAACRRSMWSVGLCRVHALCVLDGVSGRAAATSRMPCGDDRRRPPRADVRCCGWLLPACASVLLLAVTNHLYANMAAIPFLWVLPLSLYLLTFILCFEGEGWYRRNPYLQLLAVALGSMAFAIGVDSTGTCRSRSWSRCSPSGFLFAAWCVTANWCGSSRRPAI